MHPLRSIRQARGLTLRALAQLTGISHQLLSDIENGLRCPAPHQVAAIERALDLEPGSLPLPPTLAQIRKTSHDPSLLLIQSDGEHLWVSRWLACQRWLDGLDVHVPLWFQRTTRADADTEVVGYTRCIADGARPALRSPVLAGFELHPLVDNQGNALGLRLKSCLDWQLGNVQVTIWPQVSIRLERLSLRVDGLVLLQQGARRCWCVLELDGPQHFSWDGRLSDQERDRALRLPAIRLDAKLVYRADFPRLVRQRLEQVWAQHFPARAQRPTG